MKQITPEIWAWSYYQPQRRLDRNGHFVQRAPGYREYSSTTGIYLQDDWRVGSRLTLNLGLRWELETPLTEASRKVTSEH